MMIIAIIGIICTFATVVVFPWIFNRKIIPNIEKRINQKLQFTVLPMYLTPWMRGYSEIVWYVVIKHIAIKLGFNPSKIVFWQFALQKINYDVRDVTRMELILSYLSIVSAILAATIAVYYYVSS